MLGLLKKADKPAAPVVEDADCGRTRQGENGNGHRSPEPEDRKKSGAKETPAANHRRLPHHVLVLTMSGPHMVLVPRPEHGGGVDWPGPIPAKE
jgi:hypothetical protein